MVILVLLIGLALGAVGAWFVARSRNAGELAELRVELDHERVRTAENVTLLEQAERGFADRFDALAADALRKNNESFLELAATRLGQKEQAVEQLVAPLKDSLKKVADEVQTLERSRRQDYGALTKHMQTLAETSERVRLEAANLATALRASEVRGAWGQMQLRNAVESAGMLAHCDFVEEVSTASDGRVLRPDLVVRLPGGRHVVVDAKTPLKALLDSVGASEETRGTLLGDFVRHVREHVKQLSAKAYWQQFDPAPDFVIMFLPGESFYRTAVEHDPSLLEVAGRRVIVASPTMLITLLKTIAVGWREERVAESARAVSELGRELYERLTVLTEHFVTLGKRLDGAVQAYNQSVGSFERRVLVQARRLTEQGIAVTKELPELSAIERSAQPPQTVELPLAKQNEPAPSLPAADAA